MSNLRLNPINVDSKKNIKEIVGESGALLIDCDGTLILNAEDMHENCVWETLKKPLLSYGVSESRIDILYKEYKAIWEKALGGGIDNFYNTFFSSMTFDIQASLRKGFPQGASVFEKAYEDLYINGSHEGLIVRPGMADLLRRAKAEGVPIALVSNAKQSVLEASAKATGLKNYFDIILGKDVVQNMGYTPKPSGGSYILAQKMLYETTGKEVSLADSIGFEDTQTGLHSLKEACVGKIVWCNNGSEIQSAIEEPNSTDKHSILVMSPTENILSSLLSSAHTEERRVGMIAASQLRVV